jgi:hypothetical protein
MTEGRLMMIVRRISIEYRRAVESGETPEQAEKTAFLAVSAEFAGERVYVAGLPKAQRAKQIAKLQRQATREVMAATGMAERTVRRLLRGK